MNVLIVFAHHEPQSFNASMKNVTEGGVHGEIEDMLRPKPSAAGQPTH
ncbi:hypothetical protein WKW80_11275 [Variovorax humicola]|uniref:Flavodoxin-like fold domain-containing protein n=1 Tax=Variovorax humicola TaxID=1769758 RepID=A0ABU8VXX1_9BURK